MWELLTVFFSRLSKSTLARFNQRTKVQFGQIFDREEKTNVKKMTLDEQTRQSKPKSTDIVLRFAIIIAEQPCIVHV